MKKTISFLGFLVCGIGSAILLTGSSGQKTVDADYEWLPVNFYGTLEDRDGNKDEVENISISGEYKNIIFYIKPKDKNNEKIDPSSNYEKINLRDILEIKLADNDPSKALHTFKKKDYMEVVIHFKTGSEKTYIIERNKKIVCYRKNENKPIAKEVRLDALKKISIQGYKEQEEKNYDSTNQSN